MVARYFRLNIEWNWLKIEIKSSGERVKAWKKHWSEQGLWSLAEFLQSWTDAINKKNFRKRVCGGTQYLTWLGHKTMNRTHKRMRPHPQLNPRWGFRTECTRAYTKPSCGVHPLCPKYIYQKLNQIMGERVTALPTLASYLMISILGSRGQVTGWLVMLPLSSQIPQATWLNASWGYAANLTAGRYSTESSVVPSNTVAMEQG